MKKWICLLLLGWPVFGQDLLERQLPLKNNKANELFGQQQFEEARKAYLDLYGQETDNGALAYNLGNTYAALGDDEKAAEFFNKAIESDNGEARSRSRFNLGNLQLSSKQAGEAFKQYVEYLGENPNDLDAKRNLELALRMLDQQQEEQDEGEDKPQDQQDQDEQEQDQQQKGGDQQEQQQQDQSQEEKDDGQEGQQQDQQDQEQQQNSGDPQDQQDQPQQEPNPSENESEDQTLKDAMKQQILDALNEQEKQQQKEYQKRKIGRSGSRPKDW